MFLRSGLRLKLSKFNLIIKCGLLQPGTNFICSKYTYSCWSSVAVRWPCCCRGGQSRCYCSLGMSDHLEAVCHVFDSTECWDCCRGWRWGQGLRCSWSCAGAHHGSSSVQTADAGAGCCWWAGGGGSAEGRRVKLLRSRTLNNYHLGCLSDCGWTPGKFRKLRWDDKLSNVPNGQLQKVNICK